MSKIFYHGIKSYYDPNESISIMLQIISSGGIKCRRLQGVTSKLGFNGDDYISVCEGKSDYEYRKYPNNAFFRYIYYGFCFILSDNIPVIPVQYINSDDFDSYTEIIEYMSHYPGVRFSDLFDEWQVKDEIPLDYIVGLGLPLQSLSKIYNLDDKMMKEIERLYMLARTFGWDIIDSGSFFSFYNYEKVKVKKK